MSDPRYAIGIDLGTTHSALSYVDLQASDGEKTVDGILPVPQLSGPGTVEALPLLPSFLYLPHPDELAAGETALPWSAGGEGFIAGEMARSRGATTPIRLVSSAKSWLSHPSVDRRAAILPHDAPEEVTRVSPLEASTRYLAHLRQAWNAAHPEAPFDQQQVTVTIPASFDPGARELTAEAARNAGINPTLLEEPQAALYSWIQGSKGSWRKQVKAGDIVLVVDVGGGTSDFSLIAILERDGKLEPHRVAVGDHILLGGDNMDLALAHFVARKLQANGTQLDAWQMRALTYGCRSAKEHLLADADATVWPIVVPSRGSKLIGGSIRTELTRDEVTAFITDGFFPRVEASARPATRTRAGLTQVGLPYAQDAAITKHLAAFLARQVGATAELEGFAGRVNAEHRDGGPTFLHPSAVLFNGGAFKSNILAQRVMDTINDWLYMEGAEPARMLEGADLDLAVARGAAYFSYARRGGGVRIRGGTARSYYVGVESSMPAIPGMEPPIEALCVAPFGMEEGSELELPGQEFGLVVGEPVTFRFFGSTTRRQDRIGEVLEFWGPDELQEMNEIQATLPAEGRVAGDVVQVKLHALATDAGTLELAAVSREGQRWKIEFDVRNAPDQQ
ncbi:Hsp70 family protein [Massilia sp.]|uniref:Hsp70 family protein n=1 Tax=Massilia sp. TaxID=1882437 RepID=UPI00391CAD43